MNAGQALNPGEAVSDPMVEAAYELLGALEAELVALDQLVLRSRAASGRRRGRSGNRTRGAVELVVNAVAESHVPLSSAADVISAAPEMLLGRSSAAALLSEITESIGVAGELRSLDLHGGQN